MCCPEGPRSAEELQARLVEAPSGTSVAGGQKLSEFGRRAAPFRVPSDGRLTLAQVSLNFDQADVAMEFLEGLQFRKAVYAAWTTNTCQIYTTLFQFGGS